MLKNISYLLCSVFLCTFSLITVADDPIPEVTVIGKTGDGNGSFLTGRGAQEYLAWSTAQAAPSNTGSGSGVSGLNSSAKDMKDTKEKQCKVKLASVKEADGLCKFRATQKVYNYQQTCENSRDREAQSYSRCMDGKVEFEKQEGAYCTLQNIIAVNAYNIECT